MLAGVATEATKHLVAEAAPVGRVGERLLLVVHHDKEQLPAGDEVLQVEPGALVIQAGL
jgi:hypothetical protein